MRGNGIEVRQLSWNGGGERGVSGNLAHFIAAMHQMKLSYTVRVVANLVKYNFIGI